MVCFEGNVRCWTGHRRSRWCDPMNSWIVDAGRSGGSGRGRLGWVVTVGREEGEGGSCSWESMMRREGQGEW